ncbi:MAG TPA: type II secretion system protein [Burkholderiaceae bacterium]|nr:type II secretion system protein [Burkholderiaceae bacterium]
MRRAQRLRGGGFTLLELTIALAILSILVLMATPVVQMQSQRQKEAELRHDLREMRGAIDAYKQAVDDGRITRKADESGYPHTLEALVDGQPNAKDPKGGRLYFLRRIPRDPMSDDATLAPAQTWGKRSYASPPDAPAEGDDVFDVYSRSTRIGLDGRPYREW